MAAEIPVRRIAHNNHILEFIVTDDYTIHVVLCTASDPTMVDSNFIILDSCDFYRDAEVDDESGDIIENSIETVEDFSARAFDEAKSWADRIILEQQSAKDLADALASVLPPASDR
jgi:hypothetical protein